MDNRYSFLAKPVEPKGPASSEVETQVIKPLSTMALNLERMAKLNNNPANQQGLEVVSKCKETVLRVLNESQLSQSFSL